MLKNKILLICPSRNRAKQAERLAQSWRETRTGYSQLLFVVNLADKLCERYRTIEETRFVQAHFPQQEVSDMLLGLSLGYYLFPNFKYYGIIGDDVRIRTEGWDEKMIEKIENNGGWGVVHGDDLYNHERYATHPIMSANIIETIGYISPPRLRHLYIDVVWKDIGEAIDKCFYMPEVIMEHLHPHAHKAEMDEVYERSQALKEYDRAIYEEWREYELPIITRRLKQVMT